MPGKGISCILLSLPGGPLSPKLHGDHRRTQRGPRSSPPDGPSRLRLSRIALHALTGTPPPRTAATSTGRGRQKAGRGTATTAERPTALGASPSSVPGLRAPSRPGTDQTGGSLHPSSVPGQACRRSGHTGSAAAQATPLPRESRPKRREQTREGGRPLTCLKVLVRK